MNVIVLVLDDVDKVKQIQVFATSLKSITISGISSVLSFLGWMDCGKFGQPAQCFICLVEKKFTVMFMLSHDGRVSVVVPAGV